MTDSDLNRHILKTVLIEGGYKLAQSLDSSQLAGYLATVDSESTAKTPGLDAWLIDIHGGEIQQALDLLIENCDLPLLVSDEVAPTQEPLAHEIWRRRLLSKLELVAIYRDDKATVVDGSTEPLSPAAERVWVLAASLGGPEAVVRFLNALAEDLPLAMVYGQHIETNFDGFLASAIGSRQDYPMKLIRGEQLLQVGEISVVPVDQQLRFLPRGRVVEIRKPWTGDYQPALDQVIAELARVYRHKLGVIVFSGMCSDGAIGCRVAKACGSTIWAQTPDSCLSPDMPTAAINTGSVGYQGTPEELAASLTSLMRNIVA